jgi:uncharacterized protein YprB with RNaseH-like and TPR domain
VNLANRIRDVLKPPAAAATVPPSRPSDGDRIVPEAAITAARSLERALGGEWRSTGGASCFVVERRLPPDRLHGRMRLAEIAARFAAHAAEAALLTRGAPARPPFVFFDLETTGLSGGAGTYAFLVGCGSFSDEGAFITRQYVMTRYADERAMLDAVAQELSDAGALISFNGKSFDAPVLETRYLFHRLPWKGTDLPHLDALHPSRQFWGATTMQTGCSLVALERQVLGVHRTGDVPGFEIPARYFQFVRSGDASPLAAVLDHNRQDLLSLAGVTCRLLRLVSIGPQAAADGREALAIGRVYARAGLTSRAREAFAIAVRLTEQWRSTRTAAVRAAALHALALCERRGRRYGEAAAAWRALLEVPECPASLAREASEALAIHHEHRARDLAAARRFAVRTLGAGTGAARREAAARRLARIDRKLKQDVGRILWDPAIGSD